ncbi:MAG: isocitrate/isopropylmalate dehydrogenase family protein [Candidatus Parvarchaeota archaeon]|nr:isocitrate/isopropylmalate dehydrogenase family protein [Candidatus Parvarchaeota archaeon]MCL5101541.1 isocitrate/isopropylmalate dehydrogenase family protein [Candidatus Parvarchaeota archaeon]
MDNKNWKVAVLEGDGIGPDVTHAALFVLDAVKQKFGLNIIYEFGEAGFHCVEKYGTNLPNATLELLKRSDCVIKGPATTPEGTGSIKSLAVQIREMFTLFSNVRPCKSLPNVKSLKPNLDFIVVRENTEGLYSGLEYSLDKNAAVAIRLITREGCDRVCRFAFELAKTRKKHVTLVHKANILKLTDGLFKEVFYNIAKEYPDITADDAHVDAITQWLITKPETFDVLVTENLFGDIISDEAAQIVGGIGVVPGANIGTNYAMFEPIHGSAPKYTGMDKVDPIATILSIKMMLDWMGYKDAGNAVQRAVEKVLTDGKVLTYDLGGTAKCSEMGKEVAKEI